MDGYEVGYRRRLERLATDLDLTVFTQTNYALSSTLDVPPSLFPLAFAVPTGVPIDLGTSNVVGPESG